MFTRDTKVSIPFDDKALLPDTDVFGDVDAFIDYIEVGQAWQDWHERLAESAYERELFFREHGRYWRHIVLV